MMISDENILLFMCNTANIINSKCTNYVTPIKRIRRKLYWDLNLLRKLNRGSSLFLVAIAKYTSLI